MDNILTFEEVQKLRCFICDCLIHKKLGSKGRRFEFLIMDSGYACKSCIYDYFYDDCDEDYCINYLNNIKHIIFFYNENNTIAISGSNCDCEKCSYCIKCKEAYQNCICKK